MANLKPFKKGEERARHSPGRPPTRDIGASLREWLQDPKNDKRVLARILKLKPDVIYHYAYGKPKENVDITGSLQTGVSPETLALARQLVRERLNLEQPLPVLTLPTAPVSGSTGE